MRAVVVHTGGIGDFLLACPALARLAREGPIDLVGNRSRLDLAVAAGIAAAAHALDAVDFASVFTEPSSRLRDFLARFDRCIVWMRDEDGHVRRAVQRCGVRDVRVFAGLPPPGWREPASRYYLDCLGMADAPPLRLAIAPAPAAHDVIIHPGSGSVKKNWPLDRFQALAVELRAKGRAVIWCLGPAEADMQFADGNPCLRAASLVSLAGELAAARLYIGNDSGVTHLAAAVGSPTVAVFGPTDPRVWAPRGDHVTVAQGTPWPEAAAVLEAAQKALRSALDPGT